MTKDYGNSSYTNSLSYNDGKIKAVITDYDSVSDSAVSKEITIDPATGNQLDSKSAGNANSAVRLALEELQELVGAREWVDVCK